MTFSFWSLDFIYYPVSGIMWVWHKVFGVVLGYSNPWAWVLSVMFLVFTLRAILFKPFMKQMDSQLKMQAIQPEMKRIREKYKDDRQRLSEEMMKLNKEAGVNPLASCLPALMQAPVFIGLFHVLRNFITAHAGGPDKVGHVVNNYFFPASDVNSFHDALLFGGASLSAHLTMPATSTDPTVTSLADLGSNRETMLWVGIPLMILAAVATHLSSRKSIARQTTMGTAQTTGQMAIMQKLMLYGFPLGVLFIGAFYPLALLFYWLANNFWTFGQLLVAHRVQDRKLAEEAKVVDAAKESTTFTKPKPGARPQRGPRAGGPGDAKGGSGDAKGGAKDGSKPTAKGPVVQPVSRSEDKGDGSPPSGKKPAGQKPADAKSGGQPAKGSQGKGSTGKGSQAGARPPAGAPGSRNGQPPADGSTTTPNGRTTPKPGAAARPGAAPRPGAKPARKKRKRG